MQNNMSWVKYCEWLKDIQQKICLQHFLQIQMMYLEQKKLMFDLSNSLPSHSISDFHILCMYCTLYRFLPCKSATC